MIDLTILVISAILSLYGYTNIIDYQIPIILDFISKITNYII